MSLFRWALVFKFGLQPAGDILCREGHGGGERGARFKPAAFDCIEDAFWRECAERAGKLHGVSKPETMGRKAKG